MVQSGLRQSEIRAMRGLYPPKDAFVFAAHEMKKGIIFRRIWHKMMDGPSSLNDNNLYSRGCRNIKGEQPLFMLSLRLS